MHDDLRNYRDSHQAMQEAAEAQQDHREPMRKGDLLLMLAAMVAGWAAVVATGAALYYASMWLLGQLRGM